jgi:hypothetical protein
MNTSSKNDSQTLAGKCLCGAIHYAVKDEFRYALYCHCSDCRRATGSAFKPFAGIERGKLGITKGEEQVLIFGDENANHDIRCRYAARFCIQWSVMALSSTLLWARSLMIRKPARAHTFLSGTRLRGSRSLTAFRSVMNTHRPYRRLANNANTSNDFVERMQKEKK